MYAGVCLGRFKGLIFFVCFSWVNESDSERQPENEARVRGAGSFQEKLIYSVISH